MSDIQRYTFNGRRPRGEMELAVCLDEAELDVDRLKRSHALLHQALQAFVTANEQGPATEWLQRVCECHKQAKALLAISGPSQVNGQEKT